MLYADPADFDILYLQNSAGSSFINQKGDPKK